MSWETFKPGTKNYGWTIGIWKNGVLSISSQVLRQISSDWLELLYDKSSHRIALKVVEQSETAFKLERIGGSSCKISLRPFIKFFELYDITGFRYEVIRENDLFIIDLNLPLSITKPRGAEPEKGDKK